MPIKKQNLLFLFLIILFTTTTFLYKLNYPHFFTDEILYIDAGREHLSGTYESALQVPMFPKYLAAIMYTVAEHNIILLRMPFALMGIATTIFVYLILKNETKPWAGAIGALLFATSTIIYTSTRMVMLEAPMHLCWLGFHFFYYKALKQQRLRNFLLGGLFLGLAFASKITSFILIPHSLLALLITIKTHKSKIKLLIKSYAAMLTESGLLFAATYVDYFLKLRPVYGIKKLILAVQDAYVEKMAVEGKAHLVKNTLYTKSPWWTYFYYFYMKETVLKVLTYLGGFLYALRKINFFVLYWLSFLGIVFGFYQLAEVKNERYISSIEIPLIILATFGLYRLYENYLKTQKLLKWLLPVTFLAITIMHVEYVLTQQPTKYHALFNYIGSLTNNFDGFYSKDKFFIYGSTRTLRWYKHGKSLERDMFNINKEYDYTCYTWGDYTYFIFDAEELARYGSNLLYKFVQHNIESFDLEERYGFYIYKLRPAAQITIICQ